MEYPKINSLYKRPGGYFTEDQKLDPSLQTNRQFLIEGDYACPEFESINKGQIDEKIDGTNVRIFGEPQDQFSPNFGGRTDNAQMPIPLVNHLSSTFTRDKMMAQFPDAKKVIMFGEGYGPKIQACGGRYRKDVSFILFDVWIDGWWLEKSSVIEIANALDIEHTINQKIMTTREVVEYVKSHPLSYIAEDKTLVMEGVIARSYPLMLFRQRKVPIMFKLKVRDFPNLTKEAPC